MPVELNMLTTFYTNKKRAKSVLARFFYSTSIVSTIPWINL